ncbi:MAG: hypothetical protein KO217_06420 [Methanobacteriaceae archaeon]|jgi:type III secretory pathway component EscR|nr:MAG: hypothetical protein CIT01_05910 [Methanobacterium sp. BRmetb2]MCC7558304.1 hypothetical protein [Methanobacteriaceae archaeon]
MQIGNFETIKLLIYITAIVGIANVSLLLLLLKSYWRTYKELKSEFTIGLLYFSTFLLLQNIITTVFITLQLILIPFSSVLEIRGPHLPLFLINLVQLVALSILFKITRK